MNEITTTETANLLGKEGVALIDVREAMEVRRGAIPGMIHIPLGELQFRFKELNKNTNYIIVCRSGNRSGVATNFLRAQGFNALNMVGGMLDWKGEMAI